MTHLLDTCVLSELAKPIPDNRVKKFIRNSINSSSVDLYISVFTIGEIKRGINRLPSSRKKRDLLQWEDETLQVFADKLLDFNIDIAEVWAEVTATSETKGRTLSFIDSFIAATAIYYELTVVTRNVSDFEHTGARILNPWS